MKLNLKFPFVKIPSFEGIDLEGLLRKKAPKITFRGVGLFIGKEFVDLVELRRTLGSPRLVNFVSVPIATTPPPAGVTDPTAPPLAEEGAPSSHEQILLAIRKAIRESGLRSRKVVSTLSEEEVIVRYFQMPRLPRKEWDQAVRFEARKYIPFTLDELVSDFSVIEDKKDKGKMNVVFVAAKKEVIARHTALFTKANLQISHLETLSISFTRLLYTLDPTAKKEKCVCVVDIDGASGSIILIKEGLPYLVRRISLEQTEGEETQEMVEKLLDEVRLTSRYYRNQFPGENISKVFIFGDGLKTEAPSLLTQELNIPVTIPDLSPMVRSSEAVPLRLARTIGLGLREMVGEGPEIELLLAKEQTPSFKQSKLFKTLLLEGSGAIAVLFVIFLILSHYVNLQKGLLEKGREKRKYAAVVSLSKADLEKKKASLTQKAYFYRELFDRRIYWTKKLSELGNILPKGAWVTSLRLEDWSSDEKSSHEGITYRLMLKGSVYAPDKAEELKVPSQVVTAIQRNKDFFEGFTESRLISVKRDQVEGVPITSFEILLTGKKGLPAKKDLPAGKKK